MNNNKQHSIVFSMVFLVSILVPSILFFGFNGGFDPINIESLLNEKKISVFQALDADYKSKYGFREAYLQGHNEFKYDVLGESAIPRKVVVGDDGWFYLGNSSSNVIYESLHSSLFTNQEKELIKDKFFQNEQWLDSIGVTYFTCVAPNKLSVYPEYYYPKDVTGLSKFEDLQQFLKLNNWNLIDLKTKIVAKKDSIRLYHKTDTHWNDEGAYLGYLELIEHLKIKFPDIKPIALERFARQELDSVGMDLSFMLGLKNVEKRVVYKNVNSTAIQLDRKYKVPDGFGHEAWEYEIRYHNEKGLPYKVMLVRDSFSRAWLKYLKETFRDVVLVWDWKIRKEMILEEKPDILIQEIVERDVESFLE